MEAIQLPRKSFEQFAQKAKSEGLQFLGGCCGCNAAYVQAFARGLTASKETTEYQLKS
jgi:methionine synthase I (cobalamin-dependent)